jgi:hypothetical protein
MHGLVILRKVGVTCDYPAIGIFISQSGSTKITGACRAGRREQSCTAAPAMIVATSRVTRSGPTAPT